ncbi:MAG: ABC transporter permease [bacterium]
MGRLANVFASIAIFIACLGLFGLASFAAEKRTKEIGIRKVLGAPVMALISMLTKEFTRWVVLANLFAWPLAWIAMNQWLQNFAYRIEISWWVFVLAGSLALVIALLTVSTQAIRAALANPVESLRYV